MRNYLNNAVHTVFVMLGPKCNLRCRYCLQSPLRADREREAVDPEVLEFIRDIARNQCEPVSVHFYGGEPLMYQREVREIIEALDEEPNIRFSMISNGTLLTDELAGYLGASGVHYAVSWDGPNTEAVRGVDVFEAMAAGVMDGLRVVVKIFPSLVALLTAVYMLRASGVLDALTRLLSPVLGVLGIPSETGALMLLRPVSGSGALAVASELIAQYGADSTIGRTAAVMLGSTETTFYVIAVYFGAAGIKKTRYAVPAALCADLTGFVVSALTVRLFWP